MTGDENKDNESFYTTYFNYIGKSESPRLYHRWTAISIIGALLGRQFYLPFGHSTIYPNMYILLVGDPGTRKGTAMNPGRTALLSAGYNKFAPDRVSPERFIAEMSLSKIPVDIGLMDIVEVENLNVDEPSEIYALHGEFSDFIGSANFDLIKLLTNLWDNLPEYKHPKLHGKSIYVTKPTVNLYGGITPQSIATDIPVEALGQGFMSRIILVYGDPTGIKLFPPPIPDPIAVKEIVERLKKIQETVRGPCTIEPEAQIVLKKIYEDFITMDDFRFQYYCSRRVIHLVKIAMIFAAMRCSTAINKEDALHANTLLHYTEHKMPKALGEFGKAKNADVANNIMQLIRSAKTPITHKELLKKVSQDLNKPTELTDILTNFRNAGKIRIVETVNLKQGFVAHSVVTKRWDESLLCEGFLLPEEKI